MAFRSSTTGDLPGAGITSATAATALITEIETVFNAHDNWVFVKEVIIGVSPNSVIHRIWKNAGSGLGANAAGKDFHISIARGESGAGDLVLRAFEAFDAVNNKAFRPVAPHTASVPINANFSFGDEVSGFQLQDGTLGYTVIGTSASLFDFGVLVTNNFVAVHTKFSTLDYAMMAGVFESLLPNDPHPLFALATSGSENFYLDDIGVSRHPNKVGISQFNFSHNIMPWTLVSGNADVNDLFFGDPVASRLLVKTYSNEPSVYGRNRGLLYDAVYLGDGAVPTRNGDTINQGTDPYVKFKCGNGSVPGGIWLRKLAT